MTSSVSTSTPRPPVLVDLPSQSLARVVHPARWTSDAATMTDRGDADAPSPSAHDRVKVSNSKRPLFHYVRLAEKFLARRDTITVSGVGAAVATAATVGEILKSRSLATVTRVRTGTVTRVDERDPDERVGKATLELELRRSERFHRIRAEAAANAAANADDGREVIVG